MSKQSKIFDREILASRVRATSLILLMALISGCSASSRTDLSSKPSVGSAHHAAPVNGGRYKLGRPYVINGVRYVPRKDPHYNQIGLASWYGAKHHGKQTANGEIFDVNRLTAAHKTLPLPSLVRVTNLENGRQIVVRVNDRGPFVAGRIIDVSRAVARELGFLSDGTARVRVTFVGPARL